MKDKTMCAVVTRHKKSHPWKLMVLTERVSVALKSARQTQDQMHDLGEPKFEAKAIRLKDWDAKKFRARIKEQAAPAEMAV